MQHIIPMELTDLNSSIEMKLRPTYGGLPEYGTAEGDIASFITNINYPLKKLEADIVAQQDLHGYSYPWAGGTGKNISPVKTADYSSQAPVATIYTNVKAHYTYSATASNTGTGGGRLVIQVYNGSTLVTAPFTAIPIGTSSQRLSVSVDLTNATFDKIVLMGQGSVAGYNIHLDNIQLERNATMTAYEPYENICPISGWGEVVASVSGNNMLNGELTFGNIDNSGADSGTDARYIRTVNRTVVFPDTLYYFTFKTTEAPLQIYLIEYDNTNTCIRRVAILADNSRTEATLTFRTSKTAHYARFFLWRSTAFTSYNNIELMLVLEYVPYEPYNGSTYTTDLDDTYYGGMLNVTTGELTVTHEYVDLGTLTWSNYKQGGFMAGPLPNAVLKTTETSGAICSQYKRRDSSITLTSGEFSIANRNLYVVDANFTTDATAFKNAMDGVQLVYELATPQTVQLTPQEVETVVGQNHIWANSGQVYVEYHYVEDFEE